MILDDIGCIVIIVGMPNIGRQSSKTGHPKSSPDLHGLVARQPSTILAETCLEPLGSPLAPIATRMVNQ